MRTVPAETSRMLSEVGWALERGLGAEDLVPLLERLHSAAERGSDERDFAACRLAELVVAKEPWRAALLARSVLARGDDSRAWGVLGLALTVLGHYRAAAAAYRRALRSAPDDASCLHNLGHLLDAVLGRTRAALPLLARACRLMPQSREIAASYALALARAGEPRRARRVLARAAGARAADRWLAHWSRRTR